VASPAAERGSGSDRSHSGRLRVGIDSYGLLPLGLEPLELLAWARENGAGGVQFSGLSEAGNARVDRGYLDAMRQYCTEADLYLEWGGAQHIPRDMQSWQARDILAVNRRAAEQATILGTRIVRSCSGGLMRWDEANPDTDTLLAETARTLRDQRSMLRDHNVILSLELHFEFTTFELLRLFETCGAQPGDWLGICLDTMNVLTMLEEPVAATRRVLPWVTSTHIKDGGIVVDGEGMVTFPAAVGGGIVDLPAICRLLAGAHERMNLSIEDHGGSFFLPISDPAFLARFPDLSDDEYADLRTLAARTAERIAAGSCSITGREAWPALCERRLQQDLGALNAIVAALGDGE